MMEKFNTDQTQTLKWLQNKAPNIQSLVELKNNWYKKYNDQFWIDWYKNVFNVDTLDAFGVYTWCEILGLPKANFVLDALENQWAYGPYRKNYVASAGNTDPNREMVGGNFFGAGKDIVTGIGEARWALKLRYAALTSDGRIENINRMLAYIFNGGEPWGNDKYFICMDDTINASAGLLGLQFQINDWQGTYTLDSTAKTQIGRYNTFLGTKYASPSYFWSGASIASGTYLGGDDSIYVAPDGTTTAIALRFTEVSPTLRDTWSNTENYVQPNSRYIYSAYFKADEMPDSEFTFQANATFRYEDSNALDKNKVLTAQDALIKIRNGQISIELLPITVNRGAAAGGGTYTFKTNQALTGIQNVGNGWYRVWTGYETLSGSWSNISTTTGFNFFPQLNNPNAKLKFWGPMVEWLKNANTLPPDKSVGRFWFTNRGPGTSAPRFVDFIDYTIDSVNKKINLTPSLSGPTTGYPIYPSLLYPGAKLTYTGQYNYINVTTPIQVAIGNGTTTQYNIPQPPGYVDPGPLNMKMKYEIKGLVFSPQFINLLSNRKMGILPQNAGIPYTVVQIP